jgi:hypothetical protein
MKRNILLGALLLFAGPLFAADPAPKDDVTAATKKLTGESNYSWKTATRFGEWDSSSEGKTVKDGATWLAFNFNDTTTEAALQGKKAAMKTDEGWKSVDEVLANSEPGPGQFLARIVQNFKVPAAEAEDLSSKAKELKKDADTYSSDLTEAGAKALLTFGGPRPADDPGPRNAKGSVKFWLKDGALTKYELRLQGTIKGFNGEDFDIDRTTTVDIKDVGKTKVDLSEEAKKKLS